MLNTSDILETIKMIQDENLDIRTITMGISLLDCADSDIDKSCEKIYEKISVQFACCHQFFPGFVSCPDSRLAVKRLDNGLSFFGLPFVLS